MTQPASAGGKSLSFNIVGTRYTGTVVRNVTDADIERATEVGARGAQGVYATHPDGRAKVVMKVPLLMQPSAEYPTGIGVWYVKGNERSELLRAMEAAGAEAGPPRGGDMIDITYTHDEPSRSGMSPRKVKRVVYTKGNGVGPELPQHQQYGPQPAYDQQPQGYQQYGPQPTMQMAPPAPVQYAQQPDPALAYQQATGQPMPPQVNGYAPQPAQPVFQQPAFQGTIPPEYSQGYQQPPPTGAPPAQPGPSGYPSAPAQPAGAPSPSSPATPPAPGGPPPGWPPDVAFIPGLTPEQARIAVTMHHPAAGQPQ
jgi:hypothetical protein